MSKRVLISIVVLAASACLVLSLFAAAGVITLLRSTPESPTVDSRTPPDATMEETQPARETSVPPQASATTGDEISADVLAAMEKLERQTERNRGLSLDGEIQRKLLSPDQLRQRVMDDFLKDYTPEDMATDQKVLSAFGLLPRDFDLKTLYTDLFSEQVAGFYDDETGEMVVVQGEGFNGPEHLTYVHEFTHALQDEAYDLTEGLKTDEETCRRDSEYCAAVQALIEGDATLSEQLWLVQSATPGEQKQIDEFYGAYESPVYDSMPDFLQQDFMFAYQQGLDFVYYFYSQSDFAAVDQLYQDPPVSTEQILHPDRYPDDRPEKVELPDFSPVLGAHWEEIDDNSVGEWYTYLILAHGFEEKTRLDDEVASKAAEGWGGDRYAVYAGPQEEDVALIYLSQWDTPTDSDEFWAALQEYGRTRWGAPASTGADRIEWSSTADGEVLALRDDAGQILWIIAPDDTLADELVKRVTNFGR